MIVHYQNDAKRGQGYGIFTLQDWGNKDDPNGAKYSLQRSMDRNYLHPQGWDDSEYRLSPDSIQNKDGILRLLIGPEVIVNLSNTDTYRFFLYLNSEILKATIIIPEIIYPQESCEQSIFARDSHQTVLPPPSTPESETVQDSTHESEPEPTSKLQDEPELTFTSPQSVPEEAHFNHASKVFLILGILLLLFGLWTFFFLKKDSDEKALMPQQEKIQVNIPQTATPHPEKSKPASEVKATPNPQVETKTEATPNVQVLTPLSTPAAPSTQLDMVRTFLRRNGDSAKALQMGKELFNKAGSDNQTIDASFLLFSTAAEGGQPEAMLKLGEFYDPLDSASKGSIHTNLSQAWFWYSKAEVAGQAESKERKKNLRSYIEKRAAAGDPKASDLLKHLQ